jgi:hypothetical protein
MLHASISKDKYGWRLEVDGPREEVIDLMTAVDRHPLRHGGHGAVYGSSRLQALFVPRKRYKWEKKQKHGNKKP